jgi:hypothetical protein
MAYASNNGQGNECQGNSCGSQGGNGGNGGQGGNGGNGGTGGVGNGGQGGSVVGSGNSSSSSSVSNRNVNRASSSSSAEQEQGQEQEQYQGQGQGISAFNGNTTTVEAPDVKGMGSELAKHADSAGDVRSNSNPATSPCGDSTGLSGQVGVAGGGLATVTETCRAFRLQMLETVSPDSYSTKLAEITHFVGWFPRMLLHVASFGVLN